MKFTFGFLVCALGFVCVSCADIALRQVGIDSYSRFPEGNRFVMGTQFLYTVNAAAFRKPLPNPVDIKIHLSTTCGVLPPSTGSSSQTIAPGRGANEFMVAGTLQKTGVGQFAVLCTQAGSVRVDIDVLYADGSFAQFPSDTFEVTYPLPDVALNGPYNVSSLVSTLATHVLSGTCNQWTSVTATRNGTAISFSDANCSDGTFRLNPIALPEGIPQNIRVVGTNPSGDSTEASITLLLDTTAPTVSIDTPTSTGSYLTNARTVVIGGSCSTDTAILNTTLVPGGVLSAVTNNCATSGRYTVNATFSAGGTYTFDIQAVDAVLNRSSFRTLVITVDTTPPLIQITTPNGGISPYITRTSPVTISGTCSRDMTIVRVLGPGTLAANNCVASGSWSLQPFNFPADGNYTFSVEGDDLAGNRSAPASMTITVDRTPPVITVTSPLRTNLVSYRLAGTVDSDAILMNSVPSLSFALTPGSPQTWLSSSWALVEGNNFISLSAQDTAGNVGTLSASVVRDTQAHVRITQPRSGPSGGQRVLVAGTCDTDIVSLTASLGTVHMPLNCASSGMWNLDPYLLPAALTNYTFTVTAMDDLGNVATDSVTVSFDPSLPPPISVTIRNPNDGLDFLSTRPTVDLFYGDCSSSITTLTASVPGGQNFLDQDCADGNGWSHGPIALNPGANTLTITGTDPVGNASTATQVITYLPSIPVAATSLSVGAHHSCLTTGGTSNYAYCWGDNPASGPVLGTLLPINKSPVPVRVVQTNMVAGETFIALDLGAEESCGLTDMGSSYCWGSDLYGQVGDDPAPSGLFPIPVPVASGARAPLENFDLISAGFNYVCGVSHAVNPFGSIYCWGRGVASSADPQPLSRGMIPPAENIRQIQVGVQNGCVLTDAGRIYCWGDNTLGTIGDGTSTLRPSPVEIAVGQHVSGEPYLDLMVGNGHACGLTLDNIYCWGFNLYGQVGTGVLGEDANCSSNANVVYRTPQSVALGARDPLDPYLKLAKNTMGYHTCAITKFDHIYCWGRDQEGQLGDEPIFPGPSSPLCGPDKATPVLVHAGEMIPGATVTDVGLGNVHSCALQINPDGQKIPYCWGFNGHGEVGLGYIMGILSGVMGDNRVGYPKAVERGPFILP
jgi:alpha-tubulin suppressor-like RCC1 family protein